MRKILITGGCGFIGSNFVHHLLQWRPEIEVTVVDLLTYAGNLENLAGVLDDDRVRFVRGDIVDPTVAREAVDGADAIVNFAAESHVDRSIHDSAPFVHTNIAGVQALLDAAVACGKPRFVHISTDEVYGSLSNGGRFTEASPPQPNSPYSASKAAADMLVHASVRTHGLPALIVRPCNAYGPYQFPEKLIPLMIANAVAGETLPVYGDGLHVREWIHVADLCDAILRVLERGRVGQIYNVTTGEELTNLSVVGKIVELTGASESQIRFVRDRPGHDRRYAMAAAKIVRELHWRPERDFEIGLQATVAWYAEHDDWLDSVRNGEYRSYYERQYGSRRLDAVGATSDVTEAS